MKMIPLKLNVNVLTKEGASTFLISVGEIKVGNGVVGGKWNEEQAVKEIKKNPGRFKFPNPEHHALLRAVGVNVAA